MSDDELDVELLMHDLCRRLDPDKLPGGETVIHFTFPGLETFDQWWIVAGGSGRELCVVYPGREPDVRISTSTRTMVETYAGDLPLDEARRGGRLEITGSRNLVRTLAEWLPRMELAHIRPRDLPRKPSQAGG